MKKGEEIDHEGHDGDSSAAIQVNQHEQNNKIEGVIGKDILQEEITGSTDMISASQVVTQKKFGPSSTTELEGTKKNAGDSELTSLITNVPVIQQEITQLTQIGLKSSDSSKRESVGTESISISTLQVGSMFIPLHKPLESSVPFSTVAKLESVGTIPGSSVPSSSSAVPGSSVPSSSSAVPGSSVPSSLKAGQKSVIKFLDTHIVCCYRALHAHIFEDKVRNSEIISIHHFSAQKFRAKDLKVSRQERDPINANDVPKLMMLWPSLDPKLTDVKFWERQYIKNGTGMNRGQYFSKVIEIYLDFTKELTFKRNYKMTVADFEDHLTGMVPAKCSRILLVQAKQIAGLEILGDDIYLLLSLRVAVRIDPPFSVYNFVVWKGDGASVKIYRPGRVRVYPAMMDKKNNFVIVPCGTITEVIAAAHSPVEALVT